MWQHCISMHGGTRSEDIYQDYRFRVQRTFTNIIDRITDEAVRIKEQENIQREGLGLLMNTKHEFHASTMVGLIPTRGDTLFPPDMQCIQPDVLTCTTSSDNGNRGVDHNPWTDEFLDSIRPEVARIQEDRLVRSILQQPQPVVQLKKIQMQTQYELQEDNEVNNESSANQFSKEVNTDSVISKNNKKTTYSNNEDSANTFTNEKYGGIKDNNEVGTKTFNEQHKNNEIINFNMRKCFVKMVKRPIIEEGSNSTQVTNINSQEIFQQTTPINSKTQPRGRYVTRSVTKSLKKLRDKQGCNQYEDSGNINNTPEVPRYLKDKPEDDDRAPKSKRVGRLRLAEGPE